MFHPADGLIDDLRAGRTAIAVIGLGYVGLPLALCLAKRRIVVGCVRGAWVNLGHGR